MSGSRDVRPTELGGSDQRVLLLVSGRRDRELLADRLGDRYAVAVGRPDEEWAEFDLCVVDAGTYRQVSDDLAARKADADAYLPVLLLVPDKAGTRESEWLAAELGGTVDDVLVVPSPKHELDARVEALLRARRQSRQLALYRRAMDEATLGIIITDPDRPDNPIVYANDWFCRLTGYDREDVLGRNCRFLQGPDTDESTVAEIREAIDAEEPVTVELLNYRADGEPFWNLLTITPVRDADGAVTHFLGFQRDVTERVERERELERYEAIVQATSDLIYVLDREGRFVRVNDAMVEASGYDRGELLGSHASMVADEETVDLVEGYIRELLEGDREQATFEASMVFKDGVRREFAASLAILREDGEFAGTVLVAHDITELRESQRRLSVLDRVLRHNLRNRMNVVLGYSHELAHHSDPEVADLGSAIEDSARNLLELSESAREFESVVSGVTKETTELDVVELVAGAVDDARSEHPEADLSTDLPDSAPVRAHETFELAVHELLENAIVHNDTGSPTVDVSVTVDDRVTIHIADDGPGLNDVDRRALRSGTESPLEHTQGLGLWLVRWAVESVGGRLDIADNDPRGTVVTITLPGAEG